MAGHVVGPRARRDPRRRHGARQDSAGARAAPATRASATGAVGPFLVVAPTSVVPNWVSEAARFAPELSVDVRADTLAAVAGARSRRSRRRRRRHDLHAVPAGQRRLRIDAVGGLILDEAQYVKNHRAQDVPVRARAARPVQAGDHRHADGEQPDGALVAAVDHRSRAVPGPEALRGALRPADRAPRRRRADASPAPADQAAGQAANEGARRAPSCRRSRSRRSRWSFIPATASSTTPTCSASVRRSCGCSTTSIATASRSCARSRACAS